MLGEAPSTAASPRRIGALLSAALPGQEADGVDWRKGVVTWPEAAPGWRVIGDCDPGEVEYGLGDGADPVGATPFLIQTLTRCPRTELDILVDRATRQIHAVSSTAVARELWTGALTRARPFTVPDGVPFTLANPRPAAGTSPAGPWLNPHLTAATLLDAAPHPAAAVGAVEAAIGDRIAGGPIYIHVPVEFVLELGQFNIRPEGNLLRTPLGSIVVADSGYPGTTTPTGPPVVYATGPVQVWLDEPRVYDAPDQIVSHVDNTVGVWAERPALVLFDQQTAIGCPITT